MLTNWKTTVAGLLLAASGLYNAVLENKPVKDVLWQLLAAAGLIAARDHNK